MIAEVGTSGNVETRFQSFDCAGFLAMSPIGYELTLKNGLKKVGFRPKAETGSAMK